MTVLIDSDVLIGVSRGRDESILLKWDALSRSDALILFSPVNAAELWAGARPSKYKRLSALFDALACAPADAEVGKYAGDYRQQYRKSHHLELGDALIAATEVVRGATLWTRNRKHYPMKELSFFE